MSDIAGRLSAALSDRYRIERELGAGGMATVYLAYDVKHDRDVAIKVLRSDIAEALGRERFLREIRLAARLNHPHILPLYDSGEAAGFLFFVMPVMRGQTLRDRLEQDGRLPVEDAVRYTIEIADALDYAHRHDVIHRDIKPENILMHEGHVVVADFGIGKAVAAASSATAAFTQVGVMVGTPAYMSPEQAAGDEVDGRCDLFALGCVCHELLTGEAAFTGDTVQAVIAKRFFYAPPSVTDLRSAVPRSVSLAISRMLEKSAAQRTTSGAQVIADMRSTDPGISAPAPAMEKTLAVLPFTNVSSDADNEYFADGLTEELITDLAQVRALRVTSRTSSMQLKGTSKGMRAIGRELGVRYALEGSVRKAGNSLRITAQLIDTYDDTRIWGDKYTGTIDDVFDLQERVSRAIVDALHVTLSREEDVRLTDRPIANVRAFELYLQARQELRRYQLDRGNALLNQAIALEGEVPALRALRALALVLQVRAGMNHDMLPLDAAEAEARALIAACPDAAYGHAILGIVGYERGDLRQAVTSLSTALEMDPNDAEGQFYLGISLTGAGQTKQAVELSRRISTVDPLSSLAGMLAAAASWFTGRPAEGLASMEHAISFDPESLIHRWSLGYHYALLGRFGDAAQQAEFMNQRAPLMPYTLQLRALVAAAEGRADEAATLLTRINNEALDGHTRFHIAEAFALVGNSGRALQLIEDAVMSNFYPHAFIAHYDPFLDSLRGTPEFERILQIAENRMHEFARVVALEDRLTSPAVCITK